MLKNGLIVESAVHNVDVLYPSSCVNIILRNRVIFSNFATGQNKCAESLVYELLSMMEQEPRNYSSLTSLDSWNFLLLLNRRWQMTRTHEKETFRLSMHRKETFRLMTHWKDMKGGMKTSSWIFHNRTFRKSSV
jgi:hypothetical protein